MPARTCSEIAIRVASRCASSKSAPSSRQLGKMRSGSASHDGFGRLPAIVVANGIAALSPPGATAPRAAQPGDGPSGAVRSEAPEFAFAVAHRIVAPAVVLVDRLAHDLGAG